ncbi:hypothetical protein Patl1_22924 [Pistacia atlantica]|uniref:Uncharacterized protein n=1 Tax=Pistacia atlantica TaxID=434234 RepID=A0ACC0ZYY3_9ROSI|nr:hypothetical protein Patl1_22924 [Pistacia atlantica]
MWVIWVMMLLWWPTTSSNVKPGCQEKCGDVSVPFPFGIDNLNCAKNESFLLTCDRSKTPATLMFGENITTLNISVEEGIVVASIDSAMRCYNESGLMQETLFDQSIDLGGGLFRFSDTRNKLTAFGCDTLAGMGDWSGSFVSFCGSFCSDNRSVSMNITGDSCSGIGCCQTPLPKSLNSLNIILDTISNHSQFWKFNPCDYAFLADESFNISELKQSIDLEPLKVMKSKITIEWVAKEETCEAGKNSSDYACGRDARCVYSKNGQGYRCLCNEGFRGNPYLPEGCEDFNECEEPENYPCEGTCKNTLGNYTCSCPLGMRGDGKVGCQGYRILTIAAENNSLIQVLGFEVSDDDAEMEEIEEVAELAKRCLSSSVKRPSMQEVAEELERLKRLNYNFSAQQNSEETEKLLGESSFSNLEITQQDTHSVNLSEIENYSYSI